MKGAVKVGQKDAMMDGLMGKMKAGQMEQQMVGQKGTTRDCLKADWMAVRRADGWAGCSVGRQVELMAAR